MKKFWVILLVLVLFWTVPAMAQDANAPQHTGPHSVGAPTDESIAATGGGDVSVASFDSYNVAGIVEINYPKFTYGRKSLNFPTYNLTGNMTRAYFPLIKKDNFKLVGMVGWDTTSSSNIPMGNLTARTSGDYQIFGLGAKFGDLDVAWSFAPRGATRTIVGGNFQVNIPPIPFSLDAENHTTINSETIRGWGRLGFNLKINDRLNVASTFQSYDEYVINRGNTHITSPNPLLPLVMDVPNHDEKTWQSVDWRLGANYKWGRMEFRTQYENSFIGTTNYTHRSEKLRYGISYRPTDNLTLYLGRHDNELGLGASFRSVIRNAKKEEVGYVGLGWAYYENRYKDQIPQRHFSNEVQFNAGIKF